MRRSLQRMVLFLSAAALSLPHAVTAQEASQRPAEIRTGTCSIIGEPLVPLANVVAPAGDAAGPEGATPVEQSVTVVPYLLPDLLAGGYVVVVDVSLEAPNSPAACGVIGGVLTDDGTLAVGISPLEGSRLDGVAYFTPKRDDSGTTVTLLLVDNRAAANGPAGPVGMAGEDGTITIGGVTEVTDSVTVVEDGTGPAPATEAVAAPAPAESDPSGGATESAESADGKGAKGGKGERGGKGKRGGKGGKGNAGNDGTAAAGDTGGTTG